MRPSSSNSAASSRLSRSCEPAAVSAASRAADDSFSDGRHDLRVPARRDGANQPRDAAELLVLLQAVERFEHRQVRFAAGETLRAAAAPDTNRLLLLIELLDERIDERCLAHPRFRGDHDEATLAALRPLVFVPQRLELQIAADDLARDAALRLRRR